MKQNEEHPVLNLVQRASEARGPLALLAVMLLLGGCGDSKPASAQGAGQATAAAAPAAIDGEQIYNRYCFSCHAAGIAGAPKVGVAEAWQPRAAKGQAALLASTVAGIQPGMPAKGLCNSCSDAELNAAIDHMLVNSAVQVAP
ncbi:MAG: c-type cytochrome [Pseudomonadales bacterium]